MSVLSISALKSEVDAQVNTNGINAITGFIVNGVLKDIIDSMVNKIDGASFIGLNPYDPTRTYAVGQCAMHGKSIVYCTGVTTGTYNTTKWRVLTGIDTYTLADLQYQLLTDTAVGLTPGSLVLISDRNIILPVLGEQMVSSTGIIILDVPDYETINSWDVTTGSYAINAKVCWNGLNYKRQATAGNGTSPDTDATHWLLITTDRKTVVCKTGYDVFNDWIYYMGDEKGNDIYYSQLTENTVYLLGYNPILRNKWGWSGFYGNKVNDAVIEMWNASYCYGNTIMSGSGLIRITGKNSGSINNNLFLQNTLISDTFFGTGGGIQSCTLIKCTIANCTIDKGWTLSHLTNIDCDSIVTMPYFNSKIFDAGKYAITSSPYLNPFGCDGDVHIVANALDLIWINNIAETKGVLITSTSSTAFVVNKIKSYLSNKIRIYCDASCASLTFNNSSYLWIKGGGSAVIPNNNKSWIEFEVVSSPGTNSVLAEINRGNY